MAVQAEALLDRARAVAEPPVMTSARLRECQHCGQLQVLPPMPPATRAVCLRCDAVLRHTQYDPIGVPLALNVTALVLFLIAAASVLLTVSRAGQVHLADLFTGPVGLERTGWWELSAVVLFTTFAAPLAKVIAMTTVLLGVRLHLPGRELRTLFAWVERLRPWSMIEVYLLAVFVAYVRLGALAAYRARPRGFCPCRADADDGGCRRDVDAEVVWEALDRRRTPFIRPVRAGWLPGTPWRLPTCGSSVRRPDSPWRALPALRLRVARAQAEQHRAHLGAGARRADPIHSGQRLPGADIHRTWRDASPARSWAACANCCKPACGRWPRWCSSPASSCRA